MKNTGKLLITVLTVFNFSTFVYANEKSTSLATKEVVVFLNGAQVSGECFVSLTPGNTSIVVDGLPENISEEQLQVKGEGNFLIQSVVRKTNYMSDNQQNKEVKQLKDSLELLTTALEKQKGLERIYNQEEEVLMANKSIGGDNNGVSVLELEKVSNFIRNRLIELQNKKMDSREQQKKIQLQINRINGQLGQMNSNHRNQSEVIVSVSADAAQKAKLIISYFIPQAGWNPYYDIRATDTDSPLKLEYKAHVWQNTGDDWNNVKLTLSTGNPYQQNDKPQMNPLWVSFQQAYSQGYNAKPEPLSQGITLKADRLTEKNGWEADSVQTYNWSSQTAANYTQVNEGETNILFEISIPYSIPSDGQQYAVSVQEHAIPATYKYFAAPKLDADAFLVAYITDWQKYDLISTNANIYFEGMYVGKTYINTAETGDTLQFSLGRDKSISVKREKLKDLTDKKTIGLTQKETYGYEITVKNKKKKDIEIVVQDQIPLTTNKDIVIELLEKSKAEYNLEKGFLTWNFKIKSGKSESVRFSFSVQYPKDKIINGGF